MLARHVLVAVHRDVMYRLFTMLVMALTLLVMHVNDAQALPRNFRNVDVFYVGAMPKEEDLDEFKVLGITTIVSLHRLPAEVKRKGEEMGMKLYSFPLRTRLQHIDEIMAVFRNSPRNSVYLHCLHGADRTGAVTAYWIYMTRKVDPFTALISVVSPSRFHLRGLLKLGEEYGVCLYSVPENWVGRYSGAKNGGIEGLKICGSEWYTRLARNFLSETLGKPVNRRNVEFWHQVNDDDD